MSALEAATHPARSQLTRYVGMQAEAVPGHSRCGLAVRRSAAVVYGRLERLLTDEQLRDILGQSPEPAFVCNQLIEAANEAGGPDNITALVIRVDVAKQPRAGGTGP